MLFIIIFIVAVIVTNTHAAATQLCVLDPCKDPQTAPHVLGQSCAPNRCSILPLTTDRPDKKGRVSVLTQMPEGSANLPVVSLGTT